MCRIPITWHDYMRFMISFKPVTTFDKIPILYV